ncbi:MAG: hypothetical protein WCH44_12905 [Betaproteobacteria bacterium]
MKSKQHCPPIMLRDALESRISQNMNFDDHPVQLEALRVAIGHDIRVLPWDMDIECNCVMYALGMFFEPASSLMGRFYASTAFVQRLIDTGQLAQNHADGDMVVYFKEGKVAHIGIARQGDRVESKWGIGLPYDHPIWEVPSTYGDEIRCFTAMSVDDAMDELSRFHNG